MATENGLPVIVSGEDLASDSSLQGHRSVPFHSTDALLHVAEKCRTLGVPIVVRHIGLAGEQVDGGRVIQIINVAGLNPMIRLEGQTHGMYLSRVKQLLVQGDLADEVTAAGITISLADDVKAVCSATEETCVLLRPISRFTANQPVVH